MKSSTLIEEDQSPGLNPVHPSVLASCLSAALPFMMLLPSRRGWIQGQPAEPGYFVQARGGKPACRLIYVKPERALAGASARILSGCPHWTWTFLRSPLRARRLT